MDLLDGIPSLDMTQVPRLCEQCLFSIPDGLLGCPRCALAAMAPEPVSRAVLLRKYQVALRAVKRAEAALEVALQALAKDCQHEITRETEDEGDNGYGRQWKIYYRECVICGDKEKISSDYGHWLKEGK